MASLEPGPNLIEVRAVDNDGAPSTIQSRTITRQLAESGTVVIDPSPDTISAPWTLTKPDSSIENGTGDQTLTDMPIGQYSLTWGDVSGWITPANPSPTNLTATVPIEFAGVYIPESTQGDSLGYIMVDGLGGIHTTSPTGPLDLGYDTQDLAFSYDIVRGLVLTPLQDGFWVLDGFGGLHGFGEAKADLNLTGGEPLNFGWDIARDVEAGPDSQGAFILDGFGAIHALGTAASAGFLSLPRPYFGWDIARNVEVSPDLGGFVLLDGFGGVHFIGDAADLYDPGQLSPYFGWDIAKDIEVLPGGRKGYYLLDGFGGVHARGDADFLPTAYFGWDIGKDIELLPFGDLAGDPLHQGYALWQLEGYGGIHPTPDIEHEITTNMVRFSLIHYFGWDIARDFEVVTAPSETQFVQ